MIGVGVGFDTKGKDLGIKVVQPNKENKKLIVIDDTREGWVESLSTLLSSYLMPE